MRNKLSWVLLALILVVVVLPAVLIKGPDLFRPKTEIQLTGTTVKVKNVNTGAIQSYDVENYLVGVVAAEMPALFELEALKSQAVAARTYTIKRIQMAEAGEGNGVHPGAALCTDPTHCQAWISDAEMRQRWGLTRYYRFKRKIQTAVKETRGIVLTSDGKLIEPVYHSTCGGRTEVPQEVWKYTAPYLQSVECPFDRHSPNLTKEYRFTWAELDGMLGTSLSAKPQAAAGQIKIEERTITGRVRTVAAGQKKIPGTEFRSMLGLNSTRFTLKGDSKGLTIKTTGYGHGVGLCQYGADGYAREGKDFRFILSHYYPGARLTELKY